MALLLSSWFSYTTNICLINLDIVIIIIVVILMAEEMSWGFPQYQKKGLLINARAETALERKMFRDSVLHRRCIIPAKQFYEWDQGRLGI